MFVHVYISRCIVYTVAHREASFAYHYHIRAMRRIRSFLTLDEAKAMAVSVVGCRLDYCSSVLYCMSQANIDKLQLVQNILGGL